jgi:hypothetical protein
LKDALNEGYHIDHIRPLSLYPVVRKVMGGTEEVDWEVFRACWRIENLTAIPARENLQKGARYTDTDTDTHTEEGNTTTA